MLAKALPITQNLAAGTWSKPAMKSAFNQFPKLLCIASLALAPVPASAQLPPGLPALADARACPSPAPGLRRALHTDAHLITRRMFPALVGTATPAATLHDRMRARRVPGVSIAVIRGGRLLWAEGFGIRDAATCQRVTTQTAFQAGSISKSFAAVLAMRAVDSGYLSLDRDINNYLTRWKLPVGPGAPAGATVTLRQLLGHVASVSSPSSAGVRPGDPMPSLVQVLRGDSPAKGPPVTIAGAPGRDYAYSNGGYHVIQLAVEDVSGQGFAALADREILRPLGMARSSFVQPPLNLTRAAGHHEGRPFAEKAYLVPELAAGGLWTTPTDLARFLIAVREAAAGRNSQLLSEASANAMLQKGKGDWGLGFSLAGERFGHDGGFWGMMSRMWIDRATGDGIVVLANGEEGGPLADEIIRAAAERYGWSDLQSRPFAAARDAGPLYLRGSMNEWGTADRMSRTGRSRFATIVELAAGPQSFKIASEDWRTFVLGGLGPPATANRPLALSSDGADIEFVVSRAGKYEFVLDAPDTGLPLLRIAPLTGDPR